MPENYYIFRECDDGWFCPKLLPEFRCLADFLHDYGFDIPEYITYCIAENDKFRLKYRVYGGTIHIHINPLN